MVDSSNLGEPALFLYDRYPGGVGFAERGYERPGDLRFNLYDGGCLHRATRRSSVGTDSSVALAAETGTIGGPAACRAC